MPRIQIRNKDSLVLAGLYAAQGVASIFWAKAYPKSELFYSMAVPACIAFGLVWAWRATRVDDHLNLARRSTAAHFGLMLVVLAAFLIWGAYTSQIESRDVLDACIGYAVEFFAMVAGASYYLFGRRRVLAHKKTSQSEAVR